MIQEKGPAEHPYYGAWVNVVSDIIYFNDDHDHYKEMPLANISYISVVSYVDESPQDDYWIYFWPVIGGGNLSVPSKAGGFAKLIAALQKLAGFQAQRLDDALKHLGSKQILIFENKKKLVNAAVNFTGETTAFEKIEEGLWLEDRQQLIAWGSFGKLQEFSFIEKDERVAVNPQYYFYEYTLRDVTIFSGIQLSELNVETPSVYYDQKINKKWPVTRYAARIVLDHPGEETLALLSDHISSYWKKDPDELEEDYAVWKQGRVTVRLNIYELHGLDIYDNQCTMLIDYEPDLTAFFIDHYQQSLCIEDVKSFQTFPFHFEISQDYVEDSNVFYTPACFQSLFDQQLQSLIWIDENSRKIGFANSQFSRIFPYGKKSELLLEVCYWRNQLSGYTLYYKNQVKDPWFKMAAFSIENAGSEDDFINQLISLTGMPCGKQVDEQFY